MRINKKMLYLIVICLTIFTSCQSQNNGNDVNEGNDTRNEQQQSQVAEPE